MTPAGRRPLALAAIGLGLLGGSWYALKLPVLQRTDVRAGDLLRETGSRAMDRTVVATTDLGSLYAVGATAATLAATGRHRTAADVLGVGALAWWVSQSGKTRVRRERPYEAEGTRRLLRAPTGSSFPSGHATVATAVSVILAERASHSPASRALVLLGPYVAGTRVYAGVHYPTDVIGGAGLGCLLAALWRGVLARGGRGIATTSARGLLLAGRIGVRVLAGVRRR